MTRPIIVRGLGFGDEGKGTTVAALTAATRAGVTIVRDTGGPQAAHNVVTSDNVWHCFAQLGSGMFFREARTVLGPEMLVDPEALELEADILASKGVPAPLERVTVDPRCALVTPLHRFVGRMRERARGAAAHGSCGLGVGEAVADRAQGFMLTVGDLLDPSRALETLARLIAKKTRDADALLADAPSPEMDDLHGRVRRAREASSLLATYRRIMRDSGIRTKPAAEAVAAAHGAGDLLIFEGAQGILLDPEAGFVPHVTKTGTTSAPALRLLEAAGIRSDVPETLGVIRVHAHRHGAGPFVTEDAALADTLDDPCNPANPWQGPFRVGWLDLVAARYALEADGTVDGLVITSLDRLDALPVIRVCTGYACDASAREARRFFHASHDGILRRLRGHRGPDPERTAFLARCHPAEWRDFPGWQTRTSGCRTFAELPAQAKSLLRFLSGMDGLDTPLRIVSVGPRTDQKIFL